MSSKTLLVPVDNKIMYFHRDRPDFGFLSHFHPSPVELDGESWATVEHYYQAQKSVDLRYRQAIRDASTPGVAKRLAAHPQSSPRAAKKSWFGANELMPRMDWSAVKLDIMRRADFAKFSQNPDLAELLRSTGDAELIEDSPSEPFWGTGPDGLGDNWAGRVLMEVRGRL